MQTAHSRLWRQMGVRRHQPRQLGFSDLPTVTASAWLAEPGPESKCLDPRSAMLVRLTGLALSLCAQSWTVPKAIQPSVSNSSAHCIKFKEVNHKILNQKLSVAL